MYGYVDNIVPLSKIEVLRRVSQEEIYELVIGFKPVLNIYIVSPLREDRSAGSWFEWRNGILYFKDFADPIRHVRDCFQVIMEDRRLSFTESLQYVNEYFKLGLGTKKSAPVIYNINEPDKYSGVTIQGRVKKITEQRHDIIYATRDWETKDRNYWFNKYKITRNQLNADKVAPVIWFKFYSSKKKEWYTIRPFDITYVYQFPDDYVKIYRPYCEGKGKWTTNCNENIIGNIQEIDKKGDKLLIQKSYKDCRVVRNEGIRNTIWLQNEGMIPNLDFLRGLGEDFNQIIIWFDNDVQGHIAANKLTSIINNLFPESPNKAYPIFLSQSTGAKDPSDLFYKRGRTELQQFLYQQQLL